MANSHLSTFRLSMRNVKFQASFSQLHSVLRLASLYPVAVCSETYIRKYTHRPMNKTCCVYCAQFLPLHFLFSSTNFEKILYIFKYHFRKGCSSRTILKTVKTVEEEELTGMFRPLPVTKAFFLTRDGTGVEALLTYVQRQWKPRRITGAGRELREDLIHSLHFPVK